MGVVMNKISVRELTDFEKAFAGVTLVHTGYVSVEDVRASLPHFIAECDGAVGYGRTRRAAEKACVRKLDKRAV